MLDIKFIIGNLEAVKENAAKKNFKVNIDKVVELDISRRKLLTEMEEKRAAQKRLGKDKIEEAKKLKEEVKAFEPEIEKVAKLLNELTAQIPNMILPSTPVGKDSSENKVVRKNGKPAKFDFKPLDHTELGKSLDIIDLEKAAEMSGARFYYFKNDGALLEFALIQFVIQKLVSKGFTPVIPPVLVKENAMYATGFFPADKNEIYHVNPAEDDLYLVGTSEVPLTMLHAAEVLDGKRLPLRYCGFSTCFRREAGSYGKDTKGIIRVHQFDKVEMFSFCDPAKSEKEHDFLVNIEEEIVKELGLPYQLVNICSGDLGAPAAKKFDIEAWIPTQECYREITSCSNCTSYQARRAGIKYTIQEGPTSSDTQSSGTSVPGTPSTSKSSASASNAGKKDFLHTLNGTACAMPRTIVSILENYQNKDGSVTIPDVLRPYMGEKSKIEPK